MAAVAEKVESLFFQDETAWLEQTAQLIAERRFDDVDWAELQEYLTDMAKRDKREVKNRLRVLLAHLLKWSRQPEKRTGSWKATILEQRLQLKDQCQSGSLRNYAEEVFDEAYTQAVIIAAAETGLDSSAFPMSGQWTLAQALTDSFE
ncbi:MAG: DUF29 domain-containing protein [Planctomycetota bacterium]|jgi:hypothetical protein